MAKVTKVKKASTAKTKSGIIRIYNNSGQMVSLSLRAPGGDFYVAESQVRIMPKKTADLPRSHVLMDQINNLRGRGVIRVLHDDDAG